ncbi:alpha/beta fold hydrolase [Oceanobacter mangrovi]|uniref:alpha/beta fold hydrolase n=1 Tax=Oceanobacter mangrovi TaxID=2862510 RepID=UPI001C8DF860|nr:alpha/beta hydrolase [Oceanobacter mangrovi]
MWNPWVFNPVSLMNNWQEEVDAVPAGLVRERWSLPDSQFINLDGMEVHYRDSGDENKPVLLLLHGLFASLHTWIPWTASLAEDFRVISLDLPNFGLTGPHPRGMVKHLYSDFLDGFITSLGIDHCHVAGNSLGGWMAWELAVRFPHRVDKLVLIDSAGFFFVPPTFMVNLSMPGGGWLYSRSRIARETISELLSDVFFHQDLVTDERVSLYYDMLMRSGNRVGAARVMRYIRDQMGFATNLLGNVTQPTLILWGDNDPWMPPQHGHDFARLITDSQLKIYPHCGHLPMEECAAQSANDCRDFLL